MVKRITNSSSSKQTNTVTKVGSDPCDVIWEIISKKNIDVFSLKDQTVNDYFTMVNVEPTKCYLKTKIGAAIPALQTTLGSMYTVEVNSDFIIVSPAIEALNDKVKQDTFLVVKQ